MISAYVFQKQVQSSSSDAFSMATQSFIGEKSEDSVVYMPVEALYLIESGKLSLMKSGKPISKSKAVESLKRIDKRLFLTYPAYKDMRKKGYIVKTGLKFGGDFRVYRPGDKPGSAHAQWILVCEKETSKMNWHEFASKSRVAHSTRKKLMVALIDQENSPNYYEIAWTRL